MRYSFIDLETTNLEIESTKIIQLGYKKVVDGKTIKKINSFFSNGGQKISIAARVLNDITEKDLKNKKDFEKSLDYKYLSENYFDSIFIAHNGFKFDFPILERYKLEFKYKIDTLRVAQIILDDYFEELENSFKLNHIRYWMEDMAIIEPINKLKAHDAYNDVAILEQIFYGLIKIYKKQYPEKEEKDILADFVNLSKNLRILPRIPFGKHRGEKFKNIPKDYFKWCLNNMPDLDNEIKYTMKYYLNSKDQSNKVEDTGSLSNGKQISTVNQTKIVKNNNITKSQDVREPQLNIPENPKIKYKQNKDQLNIKTNQIQEINEEEFIFN